jgi:glycosyltransferase involved in cell wall biosynthesis
MHLTDDVDVLVADEPQAFARAIAHVYENRERWERLSAAGRANIERHFSRAIARDALKRLFALAPK